MVDVKCSQDLKCNGSVSIRLLEEKDLAYLTLWDKDGGYTKDWYDAFAKRNDTYIFIIMEQGIPVGACGFKYTDFVRRYIAFGPIIFPPEINNREEIIKIGCELVYQISYLVFGVTKR